MSPCRIHAFRFVNRIRNTIYSQCIACDRIHIEEVK